MKQFYHSTDRVKASPGGSRWRAAALADEQELINLVATPEHGLVYKQLFVTDTRVRHPYLATATRLQSMALPPLTSPKMQPVDQTSTTGPYLMAPNSSSGGRYHSVITCTPSMSRGKLPSTNSYMHR